MSNTNHKERAGDGLHITVCSQESLKEKWDMKLGNVVNSI